MVGQGVAVGRSVGRDVAGGWVASLAWAVEWLSRAITFHPPIKPIKLRAVTVILPVAVNFAGFRLG